MFLNKNVQQSTSDTNIPNIRIKRNSEQTIPTRPDAAPKTSTISLPDSVNSPRFKHSQNTLKPAKNTNSLLSENPDRRKLRNNPKSVSYETEGKNIGESKEYHTRAYKYKGTAVPQEIIITTKKREPYDKYENQDCAISSLEENARRKGKKRPRICACHRAIVPANEDRGTKPEVYIKRFLETNKQFYANLMQCGNVRACKVCGLKISSRRQKELELAAINAELQKLFTSFTTFTCRHKFGDNPFKLINAFNRARRKFKADYQFKKIKKEYGIVGSVITLDCTFFTTNGYHPHTHELTHWTKRPENLDEIATIFMQIWKKAAASEGLTMNEHGFLLRERKEGDENYLASQGLKEDKGINDWGLEEEIGGGASKGGRQGHYSMFGINDHILDLQALPEQTAKVKKEIKYYRKVFCDYIDAFHGKHQIQWTPGLKKRLLIEEKTDIETAEDDKGDSPVEIIMKKTAWDIIVGNAFRGELIKIKDNVEKKQTAVILGVDPKDFILILEEDKKRYAEATGATYISEAMNITREEALKTVKMLDIVSTKIRDIHPNEQTEAEASIIYKMNTPNIVFTYNACPQCGCRIKRKVIEHKGAISYECANCQPSALWSYQILIDLKNVSSSNRPSQIKEVKLFYEQQEKTQQARDQEKEAG